MLERSSNTFFGESPSSLTDNAYSTRIKFDVSNGAYPQTKEKSSKLGSYNYIPDDFERYQLANSRLSPLTSLALILASQKPILSRQNSFTILPKVTGRFDDALRHYTKHTQQFILSATDPEGESLEYKINVLVPERISAFFPETFMNSIR